MQCVGSHIAEPRLDCQKVFGIESLTRSRVLRLSEAVETIWCNSFPHSGEPP